MILSEVPVTEARRMTQPAFGHMLASNAFAAAAKWRKIATHDKTIGLTGFAKVKRLNGREWRHSSTSPECSTVSPTPSTRVASAYGRKTQGTMFCEQQQVAQSTSQTPYLNIASYAVSVLKRVRSQLVPGEFTKRRDWVVKNTWNIENIFVCPKVDLLLQILKWSGLLDSLRCLTFRRVAARGKLSVACGKIPICFVIS